ncbi:kinase-like domain, phloem protein 2-like protein [Tanacetum coccineum]
MCSPNHDDLAHLKIPLQNILEATNNFADENIRGRGEFEKRYEGQLLWSGELIEIRVRRWLKEKWNDEKEQEFWMEISLLSRLKHKNVVSLVGFCDENDEKIIIIKLETRLSLYQYLSDPMLLTWVQRLNISVGVAHAISYIHYDEPRDFSVIHRDIDSNAVLLNDDWEPILSNFDRSIKIKASERNLTFDTDKVYNNPGYTDPTYTKTKSVSHKSDIYSFGIVLFELLCGRKSIDEHPDNKYLTPVAIFHYREKILDDIIDPDLWKQMDPQSFNVFVETAYERLNEERSQRPDIGEVVTRLEEALKLQMKSQNVEHSIVAAEVEVTSSNHDKGSLTSISTHVDSHILVSYIATSGARKFYLMTNGNPSYLLTRDIVKNVYLDPKYKNTGGVTHKSDVYSFSVVLLEVLRARSAVDDEELGEGLISLLEKSHLDDMVDPHLRKLMDPESFRIFSETTYYCLQEERAKRPYIDQVVKRLDKALELQWKHENPELPKNAVDGTSSNHLKWENLEHLKVRLNDIELATENFDEKYCIGSGGFGMVYKAQLEHFDSSISSRISSLIDGENKCDLLKKRSTVAIKRIFNTQGEQGFIAEIETLTSCKHENIISLLGFCDEGRDHMILVYELASKGSLEDYMGNSDKMTNLTWMQRLKICLDIAHGLNYIHTNTDQDKQKIIHRDIKSANILLGDNWEAKIADFGLSKFHPANQEASTINTNTIAGTNMYLDPEYQKYGRLNKKSDIYSFGVVLLEILTGSLAYDPVYTKVNEKGIAPIARDHFVKGTLLEIVDHKIKEETDERVFSLSKGPDKESLDIFSQIALRCLAETQAQRPTIEVVINELKKALYCQENHKENLKLSLEDITLATQSFSQDNLIGHGDFGNVYRGHTHGHNIIAAKRLDTKSAQGEAEFMTELKILMEYKHENVIGLLGYSDEEDEKIIVYQYASKGSLDRYLCDDSLTWVMRLKICIDIAIGLEFLHGTVSSPEMVIHRDINSSNILLFDDWKAKISDFGLSLVCPTNQDVIVDNVTRTIGYRDPLYSKTGFLTKESDIFSLGAVLFDILCGKLSSEKLDDEYLYLPFLAKQHYHVGKLDELVFEGIKEQIVPQSYSTFTRIALRCLHHMRERRPTIGEVIIQLKKALEFQEDHEIWEPKLPKDYKAIIQMSKCPENYSIIKKEDLYNIFSEGILLQQDKVLLSFVGNGERNEMVSATMFSYINSCPHDWKSLPESRFEAVVEILDISNMIIEIKTRAQFLSPNVLYGVYLVFKFCDSRNCSSKPMYVNLKYRKGHESLHACFATWRDEQWMMIELHRFSNQNEHVVFEFLLESFSTYHCGDGEIFLEGIEFRAIDRVKYEESRKLKEVEVLKSNFSVDQVQQLPTKFEEIFKIHDNYDELFWLGEVNGKKLLVLSPKAALYKFSNVDLFTSIQSAESRFQDVIELLPQQAFFLKCTIRSQMLSPDTEYVCYLVFKLSETCQGLHYPVKVRDILHQENNEAEFVYFITPSPSNIHSFTRIPKQREDGWMEIQVWKFNSAHEFKDDSLSMNIKFTSREGTMSGPIVCGLEFRPMFSGNTNDIQRQREKKKRLQDEVPKPTHSA